MIVDYLKTTGLLDIGAAIEEVVYTIIETTCTVIFYTVIIIHLCHCLHTHYWGVNGSHTEVRNDDDGHTHLDTALCSPVRVCLAPSGMTSPSGHASNSLHTSSRSPAVSRPSGDEDSMPRPQVLSNAACPSFGSLSSLNVDTESLPVNSEKLAAVKPVKFAAPLRISTFTPLLDSSENPPLERSEPSTDRPQVSVAAAVPPPTDATPVKFLETASVELVLFLAWKVVSQKRVVPRPCCRLRPAPDFVQRSIHPHPQYNAKIIVPSATPRSCRPLVTPPTLDVTAVLPALPQSLPPGPSQLDVSVPPPELVVSGSALSSDCGLTRYQNVRLRPRALILDKQLYGGRKLKSLGSQPDRASLPRPTSSFSSSAPAEPLAPDVCFSKLGEAVAARRRNRIPRWMLAAANARFSAPVARSR